jgi:uncharacterized protein (DUF433 family)
MCKTEHKLEYYAAAFHGQETITGMRKTVRNIAVSIDGENINKHSLAVSTWRRQGSI